MRKWLCLFFLLAHLHGVVFPIQFSIPEEKIVTRIPEKRRDFAQLIPGLGQTYTYQTEESYYEGYRESYFGMTSRKAGWDCLRHYEILANGCIPYFPNLEECNSETMTFLPKDLILEAMNLEGVSYMHIDHSRFNKTRYYEILNALLDHTRKFLCSKAMGEYLLKKIGYSGKGKILFLSGHMMPDYQRCLTLIGLRQSLGERLIDVPKIDHLYKSFANPEFLYGKGFTYSRILDDISINRERIEERILNHEFDLIIYGSVHRGLPFYPLVLSRYAPNEIIYICGEDTHSCTYKDALQASPFFLRECE